MKITRTTTVMFKIASALAFSTITTAPSARAFSVLASKAATASAARTTMTTTTNTARSMSTTTAEPPASATAASSLENNPLLQQDDLPKFASIEPSHVTPAVETLLAKLEQDLQELENQLGSEGNADANAAKVSYEAVVPVVERMQFPLGYVWGVAGHLNGVKNGDELRKAYEANQPAIVQTFSKFSQSKPLFDALSAIAESDELKKTKDDNDTDADFEVQQRRRAVENSLRAMKLGGVGLEGADKERFNESESFVVVAVVVLLMNVCRWLVQSGFLLD